ncbi:non-heme iron oxygenase ferredoxin subunit [Candidatus Micrarchaeota archaeon]|nr:non-heme iron oxygenase ferredoxin subunit [Candidatus Micrarchaeota archaeon]
MSELVKVANVSDISAGKAKTVNVKGIPIALFNVGGKFYATHNTCLHRGGPLGEGELEDKTITCPWHGWQYDVQSGQCINNPAAKVKTFKIEVKGNEVYLEV